MIVFAVYDTKNMEQCCGVFENKKDVKVFLNVEYNVLSNALKRKGKIGRRYEVYELEV